MKKDTSVGLAGLVLATLCLPLEKFYKLLVMLIPVFALCLISKSGR